MQNPLLDTTGLPAFDSIAAQHVEPAISTIIDQQREQLRFLLADEEQYNWKYLVAPFETMHHHLNQVWSPVGHLNAVLNSDDLRDAYNLCLPILTEFATELNQNQGLFDAFTHVRENESLGAAQQKLLDDTLRDFRLAGVDLPPAQKKQFRELMRELAQLQSRFEENVLDAANAWSKTISDESQLAGIPGHLLQRARQAANAKNIDGWLFELDHPTYHTVMTHADNESLRREFYEAWCTRASDLGPHDKQWDNSKIIRSILEKRHRAAQILGFGNYAEYSLATKMAPSVDKVMRFLNELAARSIDVARAEMNALIDFAGRDLNAWDVSYYSEKLRREKFDISEEALRPYFPIDRVTKGMFELTSKLFGLRIDEVTDINTWHPDVRYFEIRDAQGAHRGSFYVDLYARSKKRGGAWMDECIGRKYLDGDTRNPVAFLVCNFTPPGEGEPGLLSHDDVVTLFHEFGHTLHHLLTKVDIPSLAGINGVEWDAVELPSQFMENFAWQPDVLAMISGHYQSDEPLPEDLFARLEGSRCFQAAMQMVRQLELATLDMRIHAEFTPGNEHIVEQTLQSVRDKLALLKVPDFNRYAHSFSHIFAGGYAAGYYSYKWAEVLSADAFAAFGENGCFDKQTANRFLENILQTGGSRNAAANFRAFRGRDADLQPLLDQCGISTATQS